MEDSADPPNGPPLTWRKAARTKHRCLEKSRQGWRREAAVNDGGEKKVDADAGAGLRPIDAAGLGSPCYVVGALTVMLDRRHVQRRAGKVHARDSGGSHLAGRLRHGAAGGSFGNAA